MGSPALAKYMNYMNLEMPVILYSHVMIAIADKQFESCERWYGELKFTPDQVYLLCRSHEFSDFRNIDTMYKLMNIHFYGERFNPHYTVDLLFKLRTGNVTIVYENLMSPDSAFSNLVEG